MKLIRKIISRPLKGRSRNSKGRRLPRILVTDAAAFIFTGMAVSLTITPTSNRSLVVDAGAFVFAGDTMTPVIDYKLIAGAGAFTLTGTDVSLTRSAKVITAGAGSFAFAGNDVTLTKSPSGLSITALFGEVSGGIESAPWSTSSISFTTGLAVVFFEVGRGGGFPDVNAVTIKGVTATKLGETTETGSFSIHMWAAAVTAGSGTVDIDTGVGSVSNIAICGWMVAGYSSATPTTVVVTDNHTSYYSDPQLLGNITVPSGGVAAVGLGGPFKSTARFPASWSNAIRDAVTEVSDGDHTCCGAHISGAGTVNPTVSGAGGNQLDYNGMIGAAWS